MVDIADCVRIIEEKWYELRETKESQLNHPHENLSITNVRLDNSQNKGYFFNIQHSVA
jgi:hypothetical protein